MGSSQSKKKGIAGLNRRPENETDRHKLLANLFEALQAGEIGVDDYEKLHDGAENKLTAAQVTLAMTQATALAGVLSVVAAVADIAIESCNDLPEDQGESHDNQDQDQDHDESDVIDDDMGVDDDGILIQPQIFLSLVFSGLLVNHCSSVAVVIPLTPLNLFPNVGYAFMTALAIVLPSIMFLH